MSLQQISQDSIEAGLSAESILSRYLPKYQWKTTCSVDAAAPLDTAYEALVNSRLENPLVTLLLRVRGLQLEDSLKGFFLKNGFVLLEEEKPGFLVVGLISRPWCWRGDITPVKTRDEWINFVSSSHAKIAAVFGATRVNDRKTRLFTETRVWTEKKWDRRKFSAYWLVVKPFSWLIRKLWLREAKKEAEGDLRWETGP